MSRFIAKLYKYSEPRLIDVVYMRSLLHEIYGDATDVEIVEMDEGEKQAASESVGLLGCEPIRIVHKHLLLFEVCSDGQLRQLSDLERRIEQHRTN